MIYIYMYTCIYICMYISENNQLMHMEQPRTIDLVTHLKWTDLWIKYEALLGPNY
jgi:hypothetical protein